MIEVDERKTNNKIASASSLKLSEQDIIEDYRLAFRSRQVSLIGRKEVMGGKAKFGIFGDGKEVPQVAMARSFQKGDFRSGYYRDQTLMFALGVLTIEEWFAQLYAHADLSAEPATGGRQMNCHFATRSLNADGSWKTLAEMYNSSADLSPTGSQMPRLVGLAYASRLYRELAELKKMKHFSQNGNEIAFGTIGNATCAEGMFWESINAIGVLRAPVCLSIWDDNYGISVSNEYQLTKGDLSELLSGFKRKGRQKQGIEIVTVRGWDYPALVQAYQNATALTRKEHIPSIIHVIEITQPQGHSTSGSHERYKSRSRLEWEREHDCLKKMREWITREGVATAKDLELLEKEDKKTVVSIRDKAWQAYILPVRKEIDEALALIEGVAKASQHGAAIAQIRQNLTSIPYPWRRDILAAIRQVLLTVKDEHLPSVQKLIAFRHALNDQGEERFSSKLHSESTESALKVPEIAPKYSDRSQKKTGFEVLNACFDAAFARDPRIVAFGEDVGQLGDVNQGMKGMQEKYGMLRVTDTGIRECTIVGQAIGMAMRGLRPIAEIQYLDYLLYALQILSDDLSTLHWRTKGGQKAPVIIRTRGHRLEGVWHSGSPMSGIVGLLRGMHVMVPRNMVKAAGFYNTMLQADEPGIIIEVLNAYRLKETMPDNIGDFTAPLGVPEVLREGSDITLVTYGACCKIALDAAEVLASCGIEAEVIDVQTLLPFDLRGVIVESLKKTNRIAFIDEDVPGGTTAYMLQQVLEQQGGYQWLDSKPLTLPGKPHRPAYGSDGDYWSKPNVETIFETVYELLHESAPQRFPLFFR